MVRDVTWRMSRREQGKEVVRTRRIRHALADPYDELQKRVDVSIPSPVVHSIANVLTQDVN